MASYILDNYSILTEDDISELLPQSNDNVLSLIHDLAPANPCLSRYPVLLCLDRDTDGVPWEACNTYKQQPISRVPSCHFALSVLAVCCAASRQLFDSICHYPYLALGMNYITVKLW